MFWGDFARGRGGECPLVKVGACFFLFFWGGEVRRFLMVFFTG